jgi:hypothetical protein
MPEVLLDRYHPATHRTVGIPGKASSAGRASADVGYADSVKVWTADTCFGARLPRPVKMIVIRLK